MQPIARMRRTNSCPCLPFACLMLTLVSIPSHSAPWEFDAAADLSIIFSDNVTLAPNGEEEDDFLYLIAPTLSWKTDGDRLDADLRYRPEAYFFQDTVDADNVFHTVDASSTIALVRDALFVAANASNYYTIISPDERVPSSNLPVSSNRAESTVFEIRPYWEQDLGFANVLAEASLNDTSYSAEDSLRADSVRDNEIRRGLFSLNNHQLQQGLAWGLMYQYRRVEYDQSTPWDHQMASADLGYWINGVVRIFASGGMESSYQNFLDPSLDEEFWESGFQYTPNQRLDMEVAVGERSFGTSYRARMSYRLRRGQTTLTYTEQPSTQGETTAGRRPLALLDNLDNFLDRPGATDRFVRKRGQWQTSIDLAKSSLSLRIFSEERTQRTTNDGDPLRSERHHGAALRWEWRLGTKSTLSFDTDFAQRDTADIEADFMRLSADYSYQLSEHLNIVFLVQHADETGSGPGGRDYTETQYRLTLRATL